MHWLSQWVLTLLACCGRGMAVPAGRRVPKAKKKKRGGGKCCQLELELACTTLIRPRSPTASVTRINAQIKGQMSQIWCIYHIQMALMVAGLEAYVSSPPTKLTLTKLKRWNFKIRMPVYWFKLRNNYYRDWNTGSAYEYSFPIRRHTESSITATCLWSLTSIKNHLDLGGSVG